MTRSTAAVSPPSSDRIEPSLAEHASPAPRLVAGTRTAARSPAGVHSTELRAGERVTVLSSAPQGADTLVRRAAFIAIFVLALVGAASLVKAFVGL